MLSVERKTLKPVSFVELSVQPKVILVVVTAVVVNEIGAAVGATPSRITKLSINTS